MTKNILKNLGTVCVLVGATLSAYSQDTLLHEEFSTMQLPAGWQNINNLDGSSGEKWSFDNPGGKGGATGITTTTGENGFAIFDSDNWGSDASPHDAVYNIIGKEMLFNHISNTFEKTSINVSELPEGIYFLKMNIGESQITKRFVIKH